MKMGQYTPCRQWLCGLFRAALFHLLPVLTGLTAVIALPAYALHPIASNIDILGVYPSYPTIDYSAVDDPAAVRRGEYLAKIGDCIACHSNPTADGAAFAGGLPIATPFGTFYTPNITPDKTTGLGKWSESDFIRAMHQGILADGSNAFPAFPYVYFNRVSEPDLKDLWAYLRAIPSVNLANRGNTLPIIANWRVMQYGWKSLFFYPDEGFFKPDPSLSAAWNRGAYLVNGLGHCTMCHTPMDVIGGEKKQYFLTGSLIEGYWAPDITRRGLESASHHQVADVFAKDQLINDAGTVAGPMAEVNHDSLGYLTDADRLAIVTYLKSVESRQPRNLPQRTANQPTLKRGAQVYANACVICHQDGAVGAPRIGDQPNWQQRLSEGGGVAAFYRNAINGFNKMPVKGACVSCDDDDIKAAVDYLLHRTLHPSQLAELRNPPPAKRAVTTSLEVGQRVYQANCSVCHDEGQLGAPKLADYQRWRPLIRKNLDQLIEATLNGKGNMPAKGGCVHCTGSEVIAAVKYLVQQSQHGNDYSLW